MTEGAGEDRTGGGGRLVPDDGDPRVVRTHLSTLFFVGDRVYKVHPPVQFPFVDLRTPAMRLADCRRELELNRRLSPDVYLGVLDVADKDRVVDHVLVMRRLPEHARLSTRVAEGSATEADIDAVARTLAAFHAGADRSAAVDAAGSRVAVARVWEDNFAETEPFVGTLLPAGPEARLRMAARRFLAGRGPLFEERVRQGHIVDGHGDLQADDVFCLEDGPRILDCLEFDDRLRHGDALADLSFLVMDLWRLSAPGLARLLVDRYRAHAGTPVPEPLLWFSCAGRAYVRAKVACFAHQRGLPGAAEQAAALQALALQFLERSRVTLTLVGGAPGTGKSALARALADATGAVVLRTDEIRSGVAAAGGPGADRYDAATTWRTYEAMLSRAAALLGGGRRVVLDATWGRAELRAQARALAAERAADRTELCCQAPESVAEARIAARRRAGTDPSEATAAVARALRARADPWPEAVVVDTSGPLERALVTAVRATEQGAVASGAPVAAPAAGPPGDPPGEGQPAPASSAARSSSPRARRRATPASFTDS